MVGAWRAGGWTCTQESSEVHYEKLFISGRHFAEFFTPIFTSVAFSSSGSSGYVSLMVLFFLSFLPHVSLALSFRLSPEQI